MPRFVLLEHDHPVLHWDFLLEDSALSALRSWRLQVFPEAALRLVATPLPPHRLLYLDYEGPVSGGRGCVKRVASGQFEILREDQTGLHISLDGLPGVMEAELSHQENCDEWSFAMTKAT